jgi:DNA-binding MarR family transcriptional regulator
MKRSAIPRVLLRSRGNLPAPECKWDMLVSKRALSRWMGTLVDYVRSGKPDLTNRQMALLLAVYLKPGPHTVRGLAHLLGVSKPVVTRALNTLGSLGYLRRERDEADRRNIFVAQTTKGADFLDGFGSLIDSDESDRAERGPRMAVG